MITIDLAIYGPLARVAGGRLITQTKLKLNNSAKIKDLLKTFNISPDDISYVFINAVLCDVPGLNASLEEPLHDNDHVGVFSKGYMWPYHYREGAFISKNLEIALNNRGTVHHTYTNE